jgi:C4-type Zn-finger protein
MTRDEIEQQQRCAWFDHPCPKCGKEMCAYGTPTGVSYDYALLCQTPECENWRKVALLDDQASSCTDAIFVALEFATVSGQ